MTTPTLAGWLRCPSCAQPLEPLGELGLGCVNGHRFDVNRRGYVTLLGPREAVVGDSAAMLDARDRFLIGGHYAPISAMIDAVLRDALMPAEGRPERAIDLGCGTGHYLAGVVAQRPASSALAVDLSPAAVARTVRRFRGGSAVEPVVDGLVANTWRPLPIRDGAATLLLNVFAPRNPAEFHRILEPAGALLVVIPRPEHLQELRAAGRVLGIGDDKHSQLVASLDAFFELEESRPVEFVAELTAAQIDDLIGMGPSAHHRSADSTTAAVAVTAAVDVVLFRRRG
ncbi:putative RNA methyltransferase [Compostimonas suwonensis]|uniref:23S rRNA (Guanine745-N1)-methyltransferase n=1 Tax=Compostimonas suwonensis TaxID=1048394 RepID=A0A2M9BAU8_9MICO|nr:hypothetical protein [Compostimonas suwonensis]PJJ55071.1 23S rRNA (guanine745-N1)-methyltransferase [Compostimonas suwonensis]